MYVCHVCMYVMYVCTGYLKNIYFGYMYLTCTVHILYTRALSDFDGDFLPDLGTQHPPADYCARNSSLGPIALKIGLKVAGPMRDLVPHLRCGTRSRIF